MQTTLGGKIIGLSSIDSEILVVIHAKRCPSVHPQMYKVPTFLPTNSPSNKGLNPSHHSIALFLMRDRHLGVLSRALGNNKFLLAAMDYFTKWVEAKPLAQIKEANVIKFNCKNILSRFGISRAFVSDNGTRFVRNKVKDLLDQLKIEFYNSTLSYP